MTVRLDELQNLSGLRVGDDNHHPDPHVKNLVELGFRDAAAALEEPENRRHIPCPLADDDVAILRQDARDVVHKAAACDVGECLHDLGFAIGDTGRIEALEQGPHQPAVTDVHFQQLRADCVSQFGEVTPGRKLQLIEKDPSRQ